MTVADLIKLYGLILTALCVWREARNQTQQARQGVWWAIQNRVGNPRFRPSVIRVILQPEQFSSFNVGDVNATKFPDDAPTTQLDWQAFMQILQIALEPGTDPTGGAVFYESEPLEDLEALRTRCPWFAAEKLTVQIDAVRFYVA